MPERQLYAAIDLGSNSFHMLVARREHDELRVIDRIKDMVRLVGGLDDDGRLDSETRQRALASLARFGQRIAGIPQHQIRTVGTQAFRQLANPASFLVVAETALSCPIDIIGGREEARLVYLGVSQGTAPAGGRRLIVDIGGGSTELVIGEGEQPDLAESIPTGCVSVTRRGFPDGRITAKRWQRAVEAVGEALLDIRADCRRLGWQQAVGSSGTLRAIETMAAGRRGVDDACIERNDLDDLRQRILRAGHIDRIELPGLSNRRRPVIVGGLAVLEAVMDTLDIERIQVSPFALREGLLHDLIGRLTHRDPRARTVTAMAERYQCDAHQAARVRDWTLTAAEQVAEAWRLSLAHTEMLEWACQLHELGLSIAHDRHARHGAYVIEHADMAGFTRQEQQFMAALVCLQRGRIEPSVIRQLPGRLQHPLCRLVAIMRLAVAFARSRRDSDMPDFALFGDDNRLRLDLPRGWLQVHPLTRRSLGFQQRQLRHIDIHLTLGELAPVKHLL